MRKDKSGPSAQRASFDSEKRAPAVGPVPDYDLLAVEFLRSQDEGRHLRALAHWVGEYRRNAPDLGRRRARKSDLSAAANLAGRLAEALVRIDERTTVEALQRGTAQSTGPKITHTSERPDPTPHVFPVLAGHLMQIKGTLEVLRRGLAALASEAGVPSRGGQPVRHDALQMGLEGIAEMWIKHRGGKPTEGYNNGGFARFAILMFTSAPVGFPESTVKGAVAEFIRQRKTTESSASN